MNAGAKLAKLEARSGELAPVKFRRPDHETEALRSGRTIAITGHQKFIERCR